MNPTTLELPYRQTALTSTTAYVHLSWAGYLVCMCTQHKATIRNASPPVARLAGKRQQTSTTLPMPRTNRFTPLNPSSYVSIGHPKMPGSAASSFTEDSAKDESNRTGEHKASLRDSPPVEDVAREAIGPLSDDERLRMLGYDVQLGRPLGFWSSAGLNVSHNSFVTDFISWCALYAYPGPLLFVSAQCRAAVPDYSRYGSPGPRVDTTKGDLLPGPRHPPLLPYRSVRGTGVGLSCRRRYGHLVVVSRPPGHPRRSCMGMVRQRVHPRHALRQGKTALKGWPLLTRRSSPTCMLWLPASPRFTSPSTPRSR